MNNAQVAVLVGSLRRDSINRKFAQALKSLIGARLNLRMLQIGDLPLYNQDDDANQHPNVKRLKSEVASCQALLFVTPEYNRSIPGVLKNAIDHASRPYGQNAWAGKPAGIVGASIGAHGSSMAQQHLRNVLAYLDVPTLGQPEVFLQTTEATFDPATGDFAQPDTKQFLQGWVDRYEAWVERFSTRKA
jgi:chromate reductase, NAD(P)H dehydrogenase (quinone)